MICLIDPCTTHTVCMVGMVALMYHTINGQRIHEGPGSNSARVISRAYSISLSHCLSKFNSSSYLTLMCGLLHMHRPGLVIWHTGHFLVGRHSSGADVVGAFLYFFADWPTILERATKMRGPQTFFDHSPVLYKIPCNQRLLEFGDSKRTWGGMHSRLTWGTCRPDVLRIECQDYN